ncbi:MAG: hypothetical protein ACJ8F1_20230 [Polyangia bacterium]
MNGKRALDAFSQGFELGVKMRLHDEVVAALEGVSAALVGRFVESCPTLLIHDLCWNVAVTLAGQTEDSIRLCQALTDVVERRMGRRRELEAP